MARRELIFLIPGFFGFANIGDFGYWGPAEAWLTQELARRGVRGEIHAVGTRPTASLRQRARAAAAAIDSVAPGPEDRVHLIGHSTGGLDARLLLSPGVSLGTDLDVEHLTSRVRTVVSIATPHRGAPLASRFNSVMGQALLELLSLATMITLRFGHLPLGVLLRLGAVLSLPDERARVSRTLTDQLFEQLLGNLSAERRASVEAFFDDVRGDQSLLAQLAPEAMDVFAATVRDRPDVRYGSIVTRARAPGLRTHLGVGFDAEGQAMHALYHALHSLAGRGWGALEPVPAAAHAAALARAFHGTPTVADNDGIVPTLSQPYGQVIAAMAADHLDIIGHFGHRGDDHEHYDWLITRSRFDRRAFESTWGALLDYLLG